MYFFLVKRYVYTSLVKKYAVHNVRQLLFRNRVLVLTEFNMPIGGHMGTHKIYDLTVVHLFKCIFDLGPRAVNMLQAPRYLNQELIT